jgi:flagellar basal-body rod protein FlgB
VFDISQVPLFALADRRLAWLDQRQQLLAQNIANADTPGWRARDLGPFVAQLASLHIALARTDPLHLAGTAPAGATKGVPENSERAPDGNGVALDKELLKVAETDTAQELTTQLTRTYLDMFRVAIGR